MDNVVRFPVEAVRRLGFERVKKKRGGRATELEGQLSLFGAPEPGEVVALPTGLAPFEEALLLDERGEHEAAAEQYRRAIEAEDCIADAYCNLGVMRTREGKTQDAFDCFTNALKHDPRHFESHYNVGNLYFETGELRPAKVHYEIAVELEPDFPNVYFNLGLVDALTGELNAAEEALSKYKVLAPDDDAHIADALLANIRGTVPE